jgi:DNA-binding SARP family transcriptional activator
MPDVQIRLLGPLEVDVDGRPVEVRRQKQRALLALLALRVGEVVSTDRLVDDLWGESPPKAAIGSLQNLVSELRKQLGADAVVTRRPGYVLAVERDAVDANRFERLTREAREAPADQRAARLRDALTLWRGPALADIDVESAPTEAARLEESRLAAWEDRLEAELELGRHGQAIGELESLVTKHPLRERPIGLLMLALYRSGRQAEALEAYRRARERLVDELGIDPSPELQRLEQAILRQDSELDLPEAPRKQVPSSEPDRRKTVTIMFADLVDSSELGARLDPELLRRVLDRYFELVRAAVEHHGGVVEKFIGDAAMAVFGIPAVHEDDALRAVRAASELRESLAQLSAEFAADHGLPLQVRIGLNTGEAFVRVSGPGDFVATGNAVNVATRLEEAALPGEILLGESTYQLVRHTVDGEAVDPVDLSAALGRASAFRLGRLGDAARPIGKAPLVGRTDELAWLQAAFAGVQAEGRSRVVTVLGDAGVGKSRLAQEFAATAGEAPLVGRCVSYGEGATFLPLDEIVQQAVPERPRAAILALLEGDEQAPLIAERVTHMTKESDVAGSTGEIFWAVRRFLEALARRRPLVVVLEDIHWAEPTLLDLVQYVDSWPARAPLLVVCLARRELLEERPGWGSRDGVLVLEPLDETEASALVDATAEDLDDAARKRIVTGAEGNPLFLEQLLAFFAEAGPAAPASVPPTVEALLGARLERLDEEERSLLERAAVAGRDFSRGALLALSPPEQLAGLDSRLTTLVRRGLVRGLRGGDDDAYRFHHVLIREVAYAGTTKEARGDLHERFAAWLEQRDGPDEIVGYHLEQAHRFRAELEPSDPSLTGLAKRAGERLADAGIHAFKRADGPATINLLGRATALLHPGDPAHTRALCELGFAHRFAGDTASGEATLNEALEEAAASKDRALEMRARIELAHVKLLSGGDPAELVALVSEAVPVFERADDDRGLGRAWRIRGYARGSLEGRCSDWLDAAEHAIAYYRRSGWSTAGCLSDAAAALFYGPTPVAEAMERCKELLNGATDRLGKAHVLIYVAGLNALVESFDDGLNILDEADGMLRELEETYAIANNSGRVRGQLHMLAGEPERAERVLRESCDVFIKARDAAALSTVGAELGQALYEQERFGDAAEWAAVAETEAPAGDIVAQFSWRSLGAKLRGREGRAADASALADEAMSIAGTTDTLTSRGHVLLDAATVLAAIDRSEEAGERLREAAALFREKGNTASRRMLLGDEVPA